MTSPDQPNSASDVPEQFRIRQAKRERLLAEGRGPYPIEVARTHTLAEIRRAYPELEANTETGQIVAAAVEAMTRDWASSNEYTQSRFCPASGATCRTTRSSA